MDVVVQDVLETKRLMFSPIRGCVVSSDSIYKETPLIEVDKQPNVSIYVLLQFIFKFNIL